LFRLGELVGRRRGVVDLLEVAHWDYCQRQVLLEVEVGQTWVHLTVEGFLEVGEILVGEEQILMVGEVVHQ
jgi:hypothetical protein